MDPFRRLANIYKQAFSSKPHSHIWIQDDVLDTIYWLRQASGLILGLIWGFLPITGLIGFISHLVIGTLFIYAWCKRQGLDEDDYGGFSPLLSEGVGPSVSVFMITLYIPPNERGTAISKLLEFGPTRLPIIISPLRVQLNS